MKRRRCFRHHHRSAGQDCMALKDDEDKLHIIPASTHLGFSKQTKQLPMRLYKHLTVAVAAACDSKGKFAAIREDGRGEEHKRRRLQSCLSFLRKEITRNLTFYSKAAGRRKNIYIYIFSVISLLRGAISARTLLEATYQLQDPAFVWSWPTWGQQHCWTGRKASVAGAAMLQWLPIPEKKIINSVSISGQFPSFSGKLAKDVRHSYLT